MSPFCGATDTPVCTSSDVCPGFKARVDFLLAHFLACALVLRFTLRSFCTINCLAVLIVFLFLSNDS